MKTPPGWHRRLAIAPFLTVGDKHVARIHIGLEQSAYDGDSKSEREWWAMGLGSETYNLHDDLAEALAALEPAQLHAAIAAAPHDFAQIVATEHALGRHSVVWPGSLSESILSDRGVQVAPPRLENGAVAFHCYRARDDELWALVAGLDGALRSRVLKSGVARR
jgi:hypothetical protein